MSKLNGDIKASIDAFDLARARELLRDALKDADAETFYLASLAALDDEQKQEFLERALSLDPFHEKARLALRQRHGSANVISSTTTSGNVPRTESVVSQPIQDAPSAEDGIASANNTIQNSEIPLPKAVIIDNLTPLQRKGIPEIIIQRLKTAGVDRIRQMEGEFASVKGPIELSALPVHTSATVAELKDGMQVTPFQRTQDMDWVRVLYASPIGMKDGWVPSSSLSTITISDVPVSILELPIVDYSDSRFGYTRNQIVELIGLKRAFSTALWSWSNRLGCSFLLLGLGLSVVGLLAYIQWYTIYWNMFVAQYPRTPDALSLILAFAFSIPSVGLGVATFRQIRKLNSNSKLKPATDFIESQIKTLDVIQKNLRSDYELMRDDQRRDAAIGFAANLGATLLNTATSRYIPNRQKVTVEYGSNKKK